MNMFYKVFEMFFEMKIWLKTRFSKFKIEYPDFPRVRGCRNLGTAIDVLLTIFFQKIRGEQPVIRHPLNFFKKRLRGVGCSRPTHLGLFVKA